MKDIINSEGSFLGFKFSLVLSLSSPLLFYFILDFKKVKLINIFFVNLTSGRDFWFKLFGKIVFSNCRKRGKNV